MQFRELGWTGQKISVIGYGSWAAGGGGWRYAWGPQEDSDSIAAIRRALELGVNWVDTAPVYGLGHSEEVVAQALRGVNPKPFIATKLGRRWNAEGDIRGDLTAASVRAEVEASLRRLNVDCIDLMQIHWPDPDDQIEEGWAEMARMVQEGKLRYIGVSNFSVSQMKRVMPIHPIASMQPPYSMLRREVEEEILPFCAANQIGVVAYSPLQKGLLTGKVTPERVAAFPEDDHRRNDSMFQEPQLSATNRMVEGLRQLGKPLDATPAQMAAAWVLRRPEVTAAIVGGRTPAQVEELAPAGDLNLPVGVLDQMEALLHQRNSESA